MPYNKLTDDDRLALAIRIAAAVEYEAVSLNAADTQTKTKRNHQLREIRDKADKLTIYKDVTADAVLDEVILLIGAFSFRECDAETQQSLSAGRDALCAKLRGTECGCTIGGNGARCRSGDPDGNGQCSRPCIHELYALTDTIQKQVEELYEKHTKQRPNTPMHLIPALVSGKSGSDVLREFHVNGWTDVRKHQIGVEIAQQSLDLHALWRIIYVLCHEFVCHAFQGLEGDEQENACDEHCWSEGWMDALAWAFAEELIDKRSHTLPTWFNRDIARVKTACHELHNRRYRAPLGTLPDELIEERDDARSAFTSLSLGLGGEALDKRKERIEDFSIKLNFSSLPTDKREDIVVRLGGLLRSPNTMRYEKALSACVDFCVARDAAAFHQALVDLSVDRGPGMAPSCR